MPHFYVPPENINAGRFHLDPDESRHLVKVLRKKTGDEVRLFDGKDNAFLARIDRADEGRVEGFLLEDRPGRENLPYRLRLFQSLPKGDKFDWILEKGTELGAGDFIPVVTERSVRIPSERLGKRLERWRKIVLSASKQCGRASVPGVEAPVLFPKALADARAAGTTLFPWEGEADTPFHRALPAASADGASCIINVFIGPEGGFTPAEAEAARAAGAKHVSLGPFILRTETAGLFAAAALLNEWGRHDRAV